MKQLPLGIKIIRKIYIINVVFYILSLLFFLNYILILGRYADPAASALVRLLCIAMPVYLYLRLPALKRDSLILAVCFHAALIINNITALLEYNGYSRTIVRITGKFGSAIYSRSEVLFLILSIFVNALILFYFFRKRNIFAKNGGQNGSINL